MAYEDYPDNDPRISGSGDDGCEWFLFMCVVYFGIALLLYLLLSIVVQAVLGVTLPPPDRLWDMLTSPGR